MGETEDKTSTLIQSIGRGMADSVPPGWARLELRVSGAGGMTDSRLTVVASDTTEDRTPTLVKQARRAVATLRKTMFQPGNGTWYNATFIITPEGNLEAEYDYDTRPFDGFAHDDLLKDDQRMWPRSPGNLPDWHPARA
ncbi:antitoxin YezG family protein [Nocardioides sp. NBC_00368]|uniref:immunity protein YezG family protein n=1 Tax=Nocardioides sp. NBC_00368 TaxID=2976000 RepID=UPI002E1A82E0